LRAKRKQELTFLGKNCSKSHTEGEEPRPSSPQPWSDTGIMGGRKKGFAGAEDARTAVILKLT